MIPCVECQIFVVDLSYQRKEEINMEYFLETSESIESGLGFSHFDALHLSWLGFFVVLIAIGYVVSEAGQVGAAQSPLSDGSNDCCQRDLQNGLPHRRE